MQCLSSPEQDALIIISLTPKEDTITPTPSDDKRKFDKEDEEERNLKEQRTGYYDSSSVMSDGEWSPKSDDEVIFCKLMFINLIYHSA